MEIRVRPSGGGAPWWRTSINHEGRLWGPMECYFHDPEHRAAIRENGPTIEHEGRTFIPMDSIRGLFPLLPEPAGELVDMFLSESEAQWHVTH